VGDGDDELYVGKLIPPNGISLIELVLLDVCSPSHVREGVVQVVLVDVL
jgi:hypothetical protein